MSDYELLDSGNGKKLERFGPLVIARPAQQAVWDKQLSQKEWDAADAFFSREGKNHWSPRPKMEQWVISVSGIKFKLSPTDFGHLGIFPEQASFWLWAQKRIEEEKRRLNRAPSVLNLFAYSGGSTLAAAKAGAEVCHLDASSGMVDWARENAALNHLETRPIRWIVEDVKKFLMREKKRGRKYDAIILDPPSFGRGAKGEIFKIEEDISPLLDLCVSLLSEKPLFFMLSCHTPSFTPLTLHHLLNQALKGLGGNIETGEMVLEGKQGQLPLPSGTFARWVNGS